MKNLLFQSKYIKKTRYKNLLVCFIKVISSLVNSIIPIIAIRSFNFLIARKMHQFIKYSILEALAFALFIILLVFFNYYSSIVGEQTKMEIVDKILEGVAKKSARKIEKDKYLSWALNDVQSIQTIYLSNIYNIYEAVPLFIFSMVSLIYINKYLLVISAILTFVSYKIPDLFNEKLKTKQEKYNISQETYLKKLKNLFEGILKFIYSKANNRFEKEIVEESNKIKKVYLENSKINIKYTTVMSGVNELSNLIICVATYILIYFGSISIGVFMGINKIFTNFMSSIINLLKIGSKLKVGESILLKFDKELSEKVIDFESLGEIKEIDIQNLKVENKLKENSLKIKIGEKYAIVGKSGSGKSTLARTLLGMEDYSGNILVNGKELRKINMKDIYDKISYVDDNNQVIYANIYDNISLFSKYDKNKIDEIIKFLNLKAIDPNKILEDTNISTGEKQRIKIARMIYQDKPIIILDEATANIDKDNRNIIEKYLLDSNKTLIYITHHLNEVFTDLTVKYIDN